MTTPHEGLTHLKKYDIKDSNVELIGSDLDHKVKYKSAQSEPAWNDGYVGHKAGVLVWRIEDFEVKQWPADNYGWFYDGDSYIILHSYKMDGEDKLRHDIFFWLGNQTSQDEAGTAAYKTVELDEFLRGVATQHREIQSQPSPEFLAVFPHISIQKGGVQSGFHHVEAQEPKDVTRLFHVFKASTGAPSRPSTTVVHQVEARWENLNEEDVFILDRGQKIWVWQGRKSNPMEKAKAAQYVHDMTLAQKIETEVVSQNETRSHLVLEQLGGGVDTKVPSSQSRPLASSLESYNSRQASTKRLRRLFKLSDASGRLIFDLVKTGSSIGRTDFDSNDVFVLDTGLHIWVWQGLKASKAEKKNWLTVAHAYVRHLQEEDLATSDPHLTPIAKVVEGNESMAFLKALQSE